MRNKKKGARSERKEYEQRKKNRRKGLQSCLMNNKRKEQESRARSERKEQEFAQFGDTMVLSHAVDVSRMLFFEQSRIFGQK